MKKTIFTLFLLMVCHLTWGQRFELRLLNHWDNPNGTVERGFAGRSIWKWEEIPAGKGSMPKELKARYEEYGRINKDYVNHEPGIHREVCIEDCGCVASLRH